VYGTLSGTVTVSGTLAPIPGAVVTATSFLTGQVATTGPDGVYLMDNLCADLYTLQAAAPGYLPGGPAQARLRWQGDVRVVDFALQPLPADPQLEKTVTPGQLEYGQSLTYTLSITNLGAGPLSGALSDTLPAVWPISAPPRPPRPERPVDLTLDLPPAAFSPPRCWPS
jgi:uncharacterized repeat protein (TIGR01451 family)